MWTITTFREFDSLHSREINSTNMEIMRLNTKTSIMGMENNNAMDIKSIKI